MPRTYVRVSDEVRRQIMSKYSEGLKVTEIAKLFNLDKRNVYKIVTRFKAHGDKELPRGHRMGILTDFYRDKLLEWRKENNKITLTELRDRLEETFNIKVTKTTVFRCLREVQFFRPAPPRINRNTSKPTVTEEPSSDHSLLSAPTSHNNSQNSNDISQVQVIPSS